MSTLINLQSLHSNHNQASHAYHVLEKIEQKLQSLITKISKQNIGPKQDSQIMTRDQIQTLLQQSKQTTISLSQKSSQILYQVEVLQILLAEKSLPDSDQNNNFTDFNLKRSFESNKSIKNLQIYISNSFSGKEKQKIDALKEIILTLCNDSQLQLKSKNFLKAQIEEYFLKTELAQKIAIQDSKSSNQHYLQKFITQISELRQQIEKLSEQNEELKKLNQELSFKIINKKGEANYQNPQLIFDKNQSPTLSNEEVNSCESCIKYLEDNKFLAFKIKKFQEILVKKENIIKDMNEQFTKQIFKYNKVFQRLSQQNDQLKKYMDYDLAILIDNLQNQIAYLKSNDRFQYQSEERRKPMDFMQRDNQYRFVSPKFYSANIPTHEYLTKNVFSQCSINKNFQQHQRIRPRPRVPQRSRSKHSQYSRPHSYKSHSPNSQIRKSIKSRFLHPTSYQRPYLNQFERR